MQPPYSLQHFLQPKGPSKDEGIKKIYVYFSHKKEWNFAISDNMNGPGAHYVKWNKSNRERQVLSNCTYMWNLKQNKTKLIDTQKRLVVFRGGEQSMGKMGDRGQKVQISSYKISKLWGCNVQHGDYS